MKVLVKGTFEFEMEIADGVWNANDEGLSASKEINEKLDTMSEELDKSGFEVYMTYDEASEVDEDDDCFCCCCDDCDDCDCCCDDDDDDCDCCCDDE